MDVWLPDDEICMETSASAKTTSSSSALNILCLLADVFGDFSGQTSVETNTQEPKSKEQEGRKERARNRAEQAESTLSTGMTSPNPPARVRNGI